ncbi:DUF72 domain-containing protein [Mucilaginibacter sp. RS28]|uniref:DUF72 domain-containing protein n=1 Tax=Mucilaginibacter straminoryzae TaxID=2932774 RepID=A0A9X1X4S2_9SPHI|nr:DUF72 domain-containing protein [Mucilaginibacter straminoryzae]MCJ8211177.1 DUF72 domain-containing protein [Mucilaginibacter straminoryzae]
MANWYIGCSGFSYRHWKGKFYPADLPQSKWLSFYLQHFNTIEINATFYNFPQLKTLEKWYQSCSPTFRFSIKAPRGITHYKQFLNAEGLIADFYTVINDGLKEKLGPVLFQMPPKFIYSDERLDRLLDNLNPSFKNVVELRDESWWRGDVFDALAKQGITFCGMSHPKLPDDVIQNTPVVYYRFHGAPELYRSPYDTAFLQKIANEIDKNPQTKEAWLYFNNDIDVAAIDNAKELMMMASL